MRRQLLPPRYRAAPCRGSPSRRLTVCIRTRMASSSATFSPVGCACCTLDLRLLHARPAPAMSAPPAPQSVANPPSTLHRVSPPTLPHPMYGALTPRFGSLHASQPLALARAVGGSEGGAARFSRALGAFERHPAAQSAAAAASRGRAPICTDLLRRWCACRCAERGRPESVARALASGRLEGCRGGEPLREPRCDLRPRTARLTPGGAPTSRLSLWRRTTASRVARGRTAHVYTDDGV
jgi:hypothetical protein